MADNIKMKNKSMNQSTILIFFFIVFVSEFITMLILYFFPPFPPMVEAIIDSTMLTLFITPAAYFTIYLPMKHYYELVIQKEAERKLLQEQFFQSEKLATLGTLGAGVAHELNNPLSVVSGYAQLILMSKEDTSIEKIKEHAKLIHSQAERMKKIVDQIKNAGHSSINEERKPSDIHKTIENSLILLNKQLVNRNITVQLNFGELPLINGYQIKLESVFQNLIINARDALEESTKEDKTIIITTLLVDSKHIRISFKDNGIGIKPENLSRVTEAFFTTKPIGKGTGLGLSLVKGIVEEHEGTLEIKSIYGNGAEFIITLPI